jgi:hypothetical protein
MANEQASGSVVPLSDLLERRRAQRRTALEKLDAIAAAKAAAALAEVPDDAADGDDNNNSAGPSSPRAGSPRRGAASAASALRSVIDVAKDHKTPAPAVLRRYEAHATHIAAALAAIENAQEAEQFALDAANKRLHRRRTLRRGIGDAFPVDPSKHLYVPSRTCDELDSDEARGARIAAARVRMYQRPTLVLQTRLKAALAGRGPKDLCSGARQNFRDRFQFTVTLKANHWRRNVLAVMKGSPRAAEIFEVLAAVESNTVTEDNAPAAPAADDSDAAAVRELSFVELQRGVSRALDALVPGMPLRVYLLLLTDQIRSSDLVRKAAVPPGVTAGSLTVALGEWEARVVDAGGSVDTLDTAAARFVKVYAERYHAVVQRMFDLAKCADGGAVGGSTMRAGETVLGVPAALATSELRTHYPTWAPIEGSPDPQPVDVTPPPLALETVVDSTASSPAGKGGKGKGAGKGAGSGRAAAVAPRWIDELCDASHRNLAQGDAASYFECFALLLVHCEPLLREALPCAVLTGPAPQTAIATAAR